MVQQKYLRVQFTEHYKQSALQFVSAVCLISVNCCYGFFVFTVGLRGEGMSLFTNELYLLLRLLPREYSENKSEYYINISLKS